MKWNSSGGWTFDCHRFSFRTSDKSSNSILCSYGRPWVVCFLFPNTDMVSDIVGQLAIRLTTTTTNTHLTFIFARRPSAKKKPQGACAFSFRTWIFRLIFCVVYMASLDNPLTQLDCKRVNMIAANHFVWCTSIKKSKWYIWKSY